MKYKILIPLILILFIINLALADTQYIQSHNLNLNTQDTSSLACGSKIISNQTIWLKYITKHSSSTPNSAIILDAGETPLKTVSFVGDSAEMNFLLTAGTLYYIVADSPGGSYTRRYYSSVPNIFPINNTIINWTKGYQEGTGDTDIEVYNILSVTLETFGGFTINMSNSSIKNNTQYNYNYLSFNITANLTKESKCSFYLNDSIEQSINFSAGTDVIISFNQSLYDGNYNYYINCYDDSSNTNTSVNQFYIDSVNPDISWIYPAESNTSVVLGTLNTNIILTDENLYSYYYNITDKSGNVIANYTNTSLSGYDTKTINHAIDLTNLSGIYYAIVKTCDGHTKNEIDDMIVIKDKDNLKFNGIEIKSIDSTLSTDYIKKSDRYNFEFKYDTPKTKIDIIVSDECKYISNSKYKGHFVCNDKYWIDFEGDYKVKVKNNIVTVESIKPLTNWKFDSIGELNCNTEKVEFYLSNYTLNYPSVKLIGQSSTFYFNMSYNSTYMDTTNVNLIYNETIYTMIETQGVDIYKYSRTINTPFNTTNHNVSFYFEYTINNNITNTTTFTQQVIVPKIDNCTNYTLTWVNYTIKDELNNSILSGSIDYFISLNYGAYTYNYNNSETGKTKYSMCLYPSWANVTGDIILQYSVDGYGLRDYVVSNYQIDNLSENINLFILEDGISSEVTVHVIDNLDSNLEGVFIEAYRWDIPTNTDKLVESETTDSDGNAIFDIKTGSEYYSFKFYQDGDLKLSTSRFKIFSTTLEYILIESETTVLEEWLSISNIISSLTYNNATKKFTFTWNDINNIADNYCLNVTSYNQSFIHNCSSLSSGSLTFTIELMNVTYLAQGLARYSGTNRWYLLKDKIVDTRAGWKQIGKSVSLILSFIVFLTIALLGLINKNAAIVSGIAALILLSLFGIFPGGLGILISMIVIAVIILIIMNKRAE